MKVEISDVGSTRKEMKVVVPKEEVNEATNEIYRDITKKVAIKGFRKGKAPRDIVKMYYADYIKGELSKKLVQDKFEQVARENDLFIVSMPEITNDPPVENEDFSFTARFDVKPVIAPQKYTGFALKRPRVDVNEDNILEVLTRLRETYATVNEVQDKDYQAKEGDYAIVDAVSEENPKLNRNKMTVEAGVRSALPGLDKAVTGMRIGEEKTVDVEFPEDHFMEDMRGKSASLKVKVDSIKQRELPELDDEFAKKIRPDAANMDELKDAIRKDLAERLEADAKTSIERQISDELIKENPIEVPESMVRLQAAMMIQGMSKRLSSQGFKLEDLYPDTEMLRTETMSSAENLVKTSLLVEAIAKEQGFEATDEELEKEVNELAQRYNMSSDMVRSGLEERGSLEEMKFGIVEKKVYNYIIDNSTVEEVDPTKENADDAGSDRS
jgi:trigger factor